MLNHGDAENIAGILESLVGQNEDREGSNQGGAITIQPDKSLNAIVVRADPTAMNEILSIVQRLDTSRAQVLIEAAIVEITLSDNLSAGIELAGAAPRVLNIAGIWRCSGLARSLLSIKKAPKGPWSKCWG